MGTPASRLAFPPMASPSPGIARETVAGLFVAVVLAAILAPSIGSLGSRAGKDAAAAPAPLETPLALDPDVRWGTLPNGVRYLVRYNEAPGRRAELRLAVDAGSVLEDDDQRGLAHGVEHMAFRGTRHFPGRSLEHYIQAVGMRSGDDLNAYTNYDETVYRLAIPTDSDAVIDTAVAILADWAHEVTFDPAEARSEAPVVFEEWRVRRDADERFRRARDRLLLAGSRYAERPTIGDTATLRRFELPALRRFYREWYRPELMTVVAVGDFDVDAVERLIRARLGAIPASDARRPRPRVPVPLARGGRAVVLTDPEADRTVVGFWYPRVVHAPRTLRDLRAMLVEDLTREVLQDRLDAASERPASPLLAADVSLRYLTRTTEANWLAATVPAGRVLDGARALAAELARLQRSGPTAAELDHARDGMLRRRHEALSTQWSSGALADALVRHALDGQPVLGVDTAYRWAEQLVPGIRDSDVVAFARRLDPASATILVTSAPLRPADRPSEAALLAAAREEALAAAGAARDSGSAVDLMDQPPESGTVARAGVLPDIEGYQWMLGNGMRVILKPTKFTSDEILVRVTAPGGASLASDADYPSAYMADRVLEATGVGPVDGYRLERLLADNSVSLEPSVDDGSVELEGSSAPRDVETLFQLLHLYLSAPRADEAAFRRYRERLLAWARDRAADPDEVFRDSVRSVELEGDPRALPSSTAFVERIDLRKAIDFWRARAANASNFTVVLVGDFTLPQLRPLVERYLGSLPAGHAERPAAARVHVPTGVVERAFRRGADPRARTRIAFADTITPTEAALADLHATRELLELTLDERLRQTMGGTYGVSVTLSMTADARPVYRLWLDFSAAPERVDSLARAALAEVARLRTSGPTDDEAERVRAATVRDHEGDVADNDYWLNELASHALHGWPLRSIATHADEAKRISAASLREACARYLHVDRFVRVTRYPAARAPSAGR